MRIISGIAGGTTLLVPKSEVRPTTDRVREALFSILGERVKDAHILDLFAGSGALSLEALSRGARSARMVDAARASCDTIRKNLDKSRLKGGQIINGDALSYVRREARTGARYDLIFADPPYCKGPADKDFLLELLTGDVGKLLKTDGIFVGEAEVGWGILQEDACLPDGWKLLTKREYGKNALLFLQVEPIEEESGA